jgi:hypothetical protein
LSDDFALANVLNDISNFETGQISVQNNSQTVAVTNTPTLNTFRIYTERDVRCKMMAEGKIIDVAVKKTSTGYNNNINHK